MVHYIWNLTHKLSWCIISGSSHFSCVNYRLFLISFSLFPLPLHLSSSVKFMDACISLVLYSLFFPHAMRIGLIDFVNAAGVFFVKFMPYLFGSTNMTSSVSLPVPIYVSSPFQILNHYSNSVNKFPWLIIDLSQHISVETKW